MFCGCTTIAKQENQDINFSLIKGIPVVTVSINGIPTKLGIDTGADNDEICITKRFITATNLSENQGTSKSIDVNGTKHTSKYYLAKNVIIGENQLSNVSISEEQREIPFDGIIGNKLLEKVRSYCNRLIEMLKLISINKKTLIKSLSGDKWAKISYTKITRRYYSTFKYITILNIHLYLIQEMQCFSVLKHMELLIRKHLIKLIQQIILNL